MQLLSEIWVQVLLAVGVFPLVYKVFTTFEDNMSEEAKKRFADAVRNVHLKGRPGGVSVRDIYESVFSSHHFSLQSIGAVVVVGTICYILTVVSIPGIRHEFFAEPFRYLTEVVYLSLWINIVTDFFALGATRFFVKQIAVLSGIKTFVVFITDTFIKFVLIWPVAYISIYADATIIHGVTLSSFTFENFILDVINTEFGAFVSMLTPVFLSSFWIWIYAGFLNLLPRLATGMETLRWLLDFENHAVRSIGFVTAVTSSLLYFFVLVATKLASSS